MVHVLIRQTVTYPARLEEAVNANKVLLQLNQLLKHLLLYTFNYINLSISSAASRIISYIIVLVI